MEFDEIERDERARAQLERAMDYTTTPEDLADVVARTGGKTEAGDARVPTARVAMRGFDIHDPAQDAMRGPLLIVADHYRLALNYARDHDLGHPGERWRYVHEVHHVRGRRGGRYVVLTDPGHRPTALQLAEREAILAQLRVAEFEEVDGPYVVPGGRGRRPARGRGTEGAL